MSEFNILLKELINSSSKNIYSLAKQLQIDRTTLTKEVNGSRKMNKEIFFKLLNRINMTVPQKEMIIELYHREVLGAKRYDAFQKVKDSFTRLIDFSYIKDSKSLYNSISHSKLNLKNGSRIEGCFIVYDAIKQIVLNEVAKSAPKIYFNLDMLNEDINLCFQRIYALNAEKIDMENIISFSLNNDVSINNLSKFINLLPFLLNGYRPWYHFENGNSDENMSNLYVLK